MCIKRLCKVKEKTSKCRLITVFLFHLYIILHLMFKLQISSIVCFSPF